MRFVRNGVVRVFAFLLFGVLVAQSGSDLSHAAPVVDELTLSKIVTRFEPSPIGSYFNSFSQKVVVTDLGDVYFGAGLGDGRRGVFRFSGGELTKVLATGDPFPTGGTFGSVGFLDANNRGDVLIAQSGWFLASDAGVQIVVSNGDLSPVGGTFTGIRDPDLNDLGQVAFQAGLADGRNGVFLATSPGIFRVVVTGDSCIGRFPRLNNVGQVTFNECDGVRIESTVVARHCQPSPLGGVFLLPQLPDVNDLGQVSFETFIGQRDEPSGSFGCGDPHDPNNWRVYSPREIGPGLPVKVIFLGGHAVVQTTEGLAVNFPHDLNNAGDILFQGAVGAPGSFQHGLFTVTGQSVAKAFVAGDPAPGGGSFVVQTGNDLPPLHGASLNDSGQVAFWARLSGGRQGIFLASPPSGLTLQLEADPNQAWANGHEEVELTARLTGSDVDGRRIHLSAEPSLGVVIEPEEAITDSLGEAHFTVTSTELGVVTFTATDVDEPSLSDFVEVEFQRHKVVVQFMGIDTSLNCIGGICSTPDDSFGIIRGPLLANGFEPDDFLWYSYNDGTVDAETGRWQADTYNCRDTGKKYAFSMLAMRKLLEQFATNNHNTDFYLVGHSQGGLIAFQELGFLGFLPSHSEVAAIITLDSPLGGAPSWHVRTALALRCWGSQAANELEDVYESTRDHAHQGNSAAPLCCSATTNASLVARAPVPVYTFGNLDDAVYRPAACNIFVDDKGNTSSQIVENAASGPSGLDSHGGNVPLPAFLTFGQLRKAFDELVPCFENSHERIFFAKSATVTSLIGPQIGLEGP